MLVEKVGNQKNRHAALRGKKPAVLKALAEVLTLTAAARKAGVPTTTVQSWYQNDPDFHAAADAAKLVWVDAVEQQHFDAAPQDTATRKHILASHRPALYGDRRELTVTNTHATNTPAALALPPAQQSIIAASAVALLLQAGLIRPNPPTPHREPIDVTPPTQPTSQSA